MESAKLFSKTFRTRKLFGKDDSWKNWKVFLSALFGLGLTAEQKEVYRKFTGRDDVPDKQFRESYLICGRRSGKSVIAALIAVFLACFRKYDDQLAPGEWGVVMILASDRAQAKVIFSYVNALLDAPLLRGMVTNRLKESVELNNRVRIEIHTSSYRAVRGRTILAAICDELAFWQAEDSANPDTEVIGALRPAMATIPNALLIGISSPYARRGELYNAHKANFGRESADVLVWQADSKSMNPTLPSAVIEAAYAKDPSAARAEFGAQFREDVETFISVETVEARTISGRRELPYDESRTYYGFADPSGGVGDSFTMAIAHLERDKAVLDLVREAQAPLSPKLITAEFAGIFKSYHVTEIEGDRYAGEWPREEFQKHGVHYRVAEKSKNELYLELLPALMSAQAELLDNPRLNVQLTGLERRTGRLHDAIDHPPGSHDDVSNAVAGALCQVLAWNISGQLGLTEMFKKHAREISQGIRDAWGELVHKPQPKAVVIRNPVEDAKARSFKTWQGSTRNQPGPPCPAPGCGSTATTYNELRQIRCNQCGRTNGKELPTPVGSCCGDFLPQTVSGQVRCGNCGWQSGAASAAGMTFAQLRSDPRSSFGRFV